MTFKIGQTVRRVEGSRETADIKIINDYTLKYVQDFVDRGYEFKMVKDVEDAAVEAFSDFLTSQGVAVVDVTPEFDLPEVKDGLRIHRKPLEECESCSS